MDKVEKLEPRAFTRFCMSIAQVPSSYIAGLTMEEQLLWFCSYLQNEVIPTVNNNGGAVEELQALYLQLKAYVDNYFENLDVQEEVNNKLDEMAESGQLADIIAQYVNLQSVLAYDTKTAMKAAENIVEGSICRTLGNSSYSDGQGAFYKVRETLNTDVIDDEQIVALHNPELVAERVKDSCPLVYDNLVALKAAHNLVAGSVAETLGYYSYNDFGGAKYRVRAKTNEDVPDDMYLIALQDEYLVAELVREATKHNVLQLGMHRNDEVDNTTIFNNIVSKVPDAATLYFPKGVYTFESPITITKRLNLEGEEISITDRDQHYGSIIFFKNGDNFSENDYCLTLPNTKSMLKNISVYGDFYDLTDNRSLCAKGVDVFTETITKDNINGVGFSNTPYGTTFENCRFRGFSGIALNSSTFCIINGCGFWKVKTAIKFVSDTTCINNRIFYASTGILVTGNINTIDNIRMDSIKEYGIDVQSAKSNIINNIVIDYCQYNAIRFYNGRNNTVSNIKARCGTIYPFDTSTDGSISNLGTFESNEDFDQYKKYLGIIQLTGYVNYGIDIQNVPVYPRNPLDDESTLLCSLFGVTVNEGTIYDVSIRAITEGEYGINSTANNFYRSYMRFFVYICSGSIRGMFQVNGFLINARKSVTSWATAENLYISKFDSFTAQ